MLPSCVPIDKTNFWPKSEKVAKPKVLFEGEMAYAILQYVGYICPHRDLVYCFVNKRKNSRYMYRFFFSLWTLSSLFLGLGEGGEKCSLLFVGSVSENIILQFQMECSPLWLSSKVWSFLNSFYFTPIGQPGIRCDTEVFGLSRSRGHVSNLNIFGT